MSGQVVAYPFSRLKLVGYKRCPKKHIIGQMRQNGSKEILLELFRVAIDQGQDVWAEVDVIGVFPIGYSIRCSVCGAIIDWHESKPRQHGGPFE